jgi:flagellar hook protein FlgE
MDVSAIALQGLAQAQIQVEASAARLIAATAATPEAMPVDTVSLSEAAVALLGAKNQFSASIEVLKTANQMQKNLVNILA